MFLGSIATKVSAGSEEPHSVKVAELSPAVLTAPFPWAHLELSGNPDLSLNGLGGIELRMRWVEWKILTVPVEHFYPLEFLTTTLAPMWAGN